MFKVGDIVRGIPGAPRESGVTPSDIIRAEVMQVNATTYIRIRTIESNGKWPGPGHRLGVNPTGYELIEPPEPIENNPRSLLEALYQKD